MKMKNMRCRLGWLAAALAVCLTAPACRTCHDACHDAGRDADGAGLAVVEKMRGIIIPEMTFYSPATIADAVDFLARASRDCDKPGTPPDRRGITFELIPPSGCTESGGSTNAPLPVVPALSVRQVSLYDALKIVCEATGMRWSIREAVDETEVSVMPSGYALDKDFARGTYDIPPELARRLSDPPAGGGGDPDKVWHAFFEQLGVTEPDFARFTNLPASGKLSVANTRENLAVIQQVFDAFALRMIEVEAFPFRQPVFGETDFQTQGWVDDGETVLIGSCSTPDGEWVQVGFLTARLRAVEAGTSGRERRSKRREDPSVASVEQKMRAIVIPEMAFCPPATVIAAIKFFTQASRDFDKPEIPAARRGIDFALKLPTDWRVQKIGKESPGPFDGPVGIASGGRVGRRRTQETFIAPADLRRDELSDMGYNGGRRDGLAREPFDAGRRMGACRFFDGEAGRTQDGALTRPAAVHLQKGDEA
jgi:hypothetical protein